MKEDNGKTFRRWLLPLVLLGTTVLWLGAADRPFGTHPFSGSQEGNGFVLEVYDDDIDDTFEIVDENPVGAVTSFAQMATDTTIRVFNSGGANGDTALVYISGIRPKRGGAKDTLAYYREMLKVDGGDSVTTDSTFHAFEWAWADSAEQVSTHLIVFATGQPYATVRLREIPPERVTSPIAHVFFGSKDSPLLESATYGLLEGPSAGLTAASFLENITWSQAGTDAGVDTVIASDNDTSRVIKIDGLEGLWVTWVIDVINGTAGGTYSLTLTPQVSVDSTNWTSIGPTFTRTASTDVTTSQVLFYTVTSARNNDTNMAVNRDLAYIDAAQFYRWLVVHAAGAADTTRITGRLGRQHNPVADGIHFELRQYPNLEQAITYTTDYVVRDRAFVTPQSGEITHDFGRYGMMLPERCYIAVMARGNIPNQAGYVKIVGQRRARR